VMKVSTTEEINRADVRIVGGLRFEGVLVN